MIYINIKKNQIYRMLARKIYKVKTFAPSLVHPLLSSFIAE